MQVPQSVGLTAPGTKYVPTPHVMGEHADALTAAQKPVLHWLHEHVDVRTYPAGQEEAHSVHADTEVAPGTDVP